MASNSKKLFFQHSYDLEEEPRMKQLDKKIPDAGPGVFWKIQRRIRLGNGTYPVNALITEIAGTNKVRIRRVQRVLTEFDLFIIDQGMVSLAAGLSISELQPRKSRQSDNRDRLQRLQQTISEGYDDNLFPEESRQMDEAAISRIQDDIRQQNLEQLNALSS